MKFGNTAITAWQAEISLRVWLARPTVNDAELNELRRKLFVQG